MRSFLRYAGVSLGVAGLLVLLVGGSSGRTDAVWPMVALAYGTQLAAYGMLIAVYGRTRFFLGWGGGILLRFAALGAGAVWVVRAELDRPALRLLSLAGALFVLALLEPLFIRRRSQA